MTTKGEVIMDDTDMDIWAATVIKRCTEGFVKPKRERREVAVGYVSKLTGQAKLMWLNQNRKMF